MGRILPRHCGVVAVLSPGISSLGCICFGVRGVAHKTALGEGRQVLYRNKGWTVPCLGGDYLAWKKGFYKPPVTGGPGQETFAEKEGKGALSKRDFITLT